jgi:hypothetical protein
MSGAVSHKLITVSRVASNVTNRLVPARQFSANGECTSGIRYSAGPAPRWQAFRNAGWHKRHMWHDPEIGQATTGAHSIFGKGIKRAEARQCDVPPVGGGRATGRP